MGVFVAATGQRRADGTLMLVAQLLLLFASDGRRRGERGGLLLFSSDRGWRRRCSGGGGSGGVWGRSGALLFACDRWRRRGGGGCGMASVHLLLHAAACPLVRTGAVEHHLGEPLHGPALQFGHNLGQICRRSLVDHGHVPQDVSFAPGLVSTQRAAVELDEDVVAVCVQFNVFG